MKKYDFKKIEKRWQAVWRKEKIYEPELVPGKAKGKKPFYNLMMFPYPSAEGLHIGAMRTFTGIDMYGRFKRMQGYDVFEPIGLDAFGIHSENYALKTGRHPTKQATILERNFYRQLAMMGNGFAWREHLETNDVEYYRWTQWIFVQMFKRGLAYRKKQPVNWCPSCKTVLADEQVISGECERCGTVVVKKELEQWFFRITDYADRLLKNLEKLDWSERVKIAQKNWIGKSEGAEISFPISGKHNFVLLHGYQGTPQGIFFPWLIAALNKRGYQVQAPALPNSKNPDTEEQARYVLEHMKFDRDTILLGHSLGARVALRIAENLKQPIAQLVLAAGRATPRKVNPPAYDLNFNWRFNFAKIKKNAGNILILRDTTDTVVSAEKGDELRKFLDAKIVDFVAEKPHMCGGKEPEILKNILPEIKVFTTRPDTLFGATYMVLAPEHPLVSGIKHRVSNWNEVGAYIKKAKATPEKERIAEGKEKTGVELKGVSAMNPATKKEIPIWISDYVLMGYGTGAIMAVPAHDKRDYEFAKRFDLEIKNVIDPITTDVKQNNPKEKQKIVAVVENKNGEILTINWGKLGGRLLIGGTIEAGEDPIKTAAREIAEETGYDDLECIECAEETVHHEYFSYVRNQAYRAHTKPIYFRLRSMRKKIQDLDDHEHGKFSVEWVSKERAEKEIQDSLHQYVYHRFIIGNFYEGSAIVSNSGKFTGRDSEKAKWEITEFVGGRRVSHYHLRDWLLSRQRYWGPPIPMIFCDACATAHRGERKEMPGWYAVLEKDLPVKLPFVKNFRPTGTDRSPLAAVEKFYKVRCPGCKEWARRETDVSDTFLDSAWYFLRYPSTRSARSGQVPWDSAITKKWLPVSVYIGGAEHSVLHLLYSRFLTMAFYDWKLLRFDEPFPKFRAHGLITKDGAKMSKSKGNVVNPDDYIRAFGADAIRMYLAFMAPFEQSGDFRDAGILGVKRFLERVWKIANEKLKTKNEKHIGDSTAIKRALHKAIKKVSDDIENLRYNTAISALMVLLNELEASQGGVTRDDIRSFLKLLAPFAPHISEELWQREHGLTQTKHGQTPTKFLRTSATSQRQSAFNSIHLAPWPAHDPRLIEEKTFTLIIQVNGKFRDSASVPVGLTEPEARAIAMNRDKIKKFVDPAQVKKFVYVPGRLINIVVQS